MASTLPFSFIATDPVYNLRGSVKEVTMYENDHFLGKQILLEKVKVDIAAHTIHRSLPSEGHYQVEHYNTNGMLQKVELYIENKLTSTEIYHSFPGINYLFYAGSIDATGLEELHSHRYEFDAKEQIVRETWDRQRAQGHPADYVMHFSETGQLLNREIILEGAPEKYELYRYDSHGHLIEIAYYIGGQLNETELWNYTFDASQNWVTAKMSMAHYENPFLEKWNSEWFKQTGIKQTRIDSSLSADNSEPSLIYDYSREIIYS